jgi:hypothetical protein
MSVRVVATESRIREKTSPALAGVAVVLAPILDLRIVRLPREKFGESAMTTI